MAHTFISFGVLAFAFVVTAIIIAVFKIPKWIWIVAAFFVLIFAILLPAILGGMLGFFPYVYSPVFQFPWIWMAALPLNPSLDFIGFWMAAGGALLVMITGFFVPKK